MARQTRSSLGYRVLCAADGGSDAAELLLERFPELYIIFTRGYSRDCDGRTANLAHTSYLQKPYSPTNLGRLVRKVLDVGVKAGVLLTNASLDAGRAALTVH